MLLSALRHIHVTSREVCSTLTYTTTAGLDIIYRKSCEVVELLVSSTYTLNLEKSCVHPAAGRIEIYP